MSDGGHQQPAHHIGLDQDKRPNEYYIDQHWDRCIDLTLRRVTYCALAAGIGSLVLLSEFAGTQQSVQW